MNLAQLLNSDLPIINFDLETDGVADGSRIVEIGHQVHRPDGEIKEWRSYVNPGRPMPAELTDIHGITDEDFTRCQRCNRLPGDHEGSSCEEFRQVPTFAQIAQNLARGYTNCHYSGKNIRFDLGILFDEFHRVRVAWSYAEACVIDIERLESIIEPRTLSAMYQRRLGKDSVDAHSALADVRMAHEILVDQFTKSDLPRDVRQLHDLQWPGWIDCEGKLRRGKDGVVRIQFGKHRSRDVRTIEPSYWTWILKQDFSAEFKALAAEMAVGRFP